VVEIKSIKDDRHELGGNANPKVFARLFKFAHAQHSTLVVVHLSKNGLQPNDTSATSAFYLVSEEPHHHFDLNLILIRLLTLLLLVVIYWAAGPFGLSFLSCFVRADELFIINGAVTWLVKEVENDLHVLVFGHNYADLCNCALKLVQTNFTVVLNVEEFEGLVQEGVFV
jgi:hypothetical protein